LAVPVLNALLIDRPKENVPLRVNRLADFNARLLDEDKRVCFGRLQDTTDLEVFDHSAEPAGNRPFDRGRFARNVRPQQGNHQGAPYSGFRVHA
jgi:hypothetical protein